MSTLTIDIVADDYAAALAELTDGLTVTAADTGGRQAGGNVETTFIGSRQELTTLATRYAGDDINGVAYYADMIQD